MLNDNGQGKANSTPENKTGGLKKDYFLTLAFGLEVDNYLSPPYAMINCSFISILSILKMLTRKPNMNTLMNLNRRHSRIVAMMKPGWR